MKDRKRKWTVETNITTRWEKRMPHHPKSINLFKQLDKIDLEFGGDFFCWSSGGDGDNGEHLMYEMDIIFEQDDIDAKLASDAGV